jgi:hypothetical protein
MHRRVAILSVIGIIAFFAVCYGGYFLFHGLGQAEAPGSSSFAPIDPRMIFHLILSPCLLLASLFVILAERYTPADKHWAHGTTGTIVGFWLKA